MLTAHSNAEVPRDSTARRVIGILASLLEVPPAELDPDMPFADLGIDSADFIEIQLMLIEEFDIELADPEEAAQRLREIRDLVELVEERLAAA